MRLVRRGRGRPRKFGRPARPVTVTLPEDVIAHLGSIDADLGVAIVNAMARRRSPRPRDVHPAELVSYGNHAVIVVTPLNALKRLEGVQLVPIGPNRALISLDQPRSIAEFELSVRDALDRYKVGQRERKALELIADILRDARVSGNLEMEERSIIVLAAKRRRSAAAPSRRRNA